MIGNIVRLMLEGIVLYSLISWLMAFIVLFAHRDATPDKTLRQLAYEAVVTAFTHPRDLAHSIYGLALRVIASLRK